MTTSSHDTAGLRACLARISQRKIFFGHQSVGAEVLQGLGALAEGLAVPINIVETRRIEALGGPCLAHALIGRNCDAVSKLNDFAALLDGGLGSDLDLAMAKLCYVDVTRSTDTGELARRHENLFNALAGRYPDLRIVPVTVPLTTGFFGLRGKAAKFLGRTDPAEPDNRARTRYNDSLRTRHAESGQLYDLASVESNTISRDHGEGGTPSLSPELTSDGGHLNQRGRKLAAIELVRTLGRLL